MLVVNKVDDYENRFEKLEMLNVQPSFQLNQTLVNETYDYETWNFDRLAERRRQRWEFYLKTPPYCKNNFERLVKRIEGSKFTVEEFCRRLAILYKLISFDSHLESVVTINRATGTLSHYHKYHFVISVLLADHTKTELIQKIFSELKS